MPASGGKARYAPGIWRGCCSCTTRRRRNIGYMSGALKHFFDTIYYPCLEATRRRPYALYVHGASDTTGAVRAVESITSGLGWRQVRPAVCVTGGPPLRSDLEACWELGAVLAAGLGG